MLRHMIWIVALALSVYSPRAQSGPCDCPPGIFEDCNVDDPCPYSGTPSGGFPAIPPESDRSFVKSFQSPGCDYGSEIIVNIAVDRVVGKVHPPSAGVNKAYRLVDPDGLVTLGRVGPYARLRIAAWDVDTDGSACRSPEIDKVYFNGHYLGKLKGKNNAWSITEFMVPIEKVKFPQLPCDVYGCSQDVDYPSYPVDRMDEPQPGPANVPNTIRIDVDTSRTNGEECWCVAIKWASLEIRATSPAVLIHGLLGSPAFWTNSSPPVTGVEALNVEKWLWDCSIQTIRQGDLAAAPSKSGNQIAAIRISELLPRIAKAYGVDSVHLIAHSYGGLNSLELLANKVNMTGVPQGFVIEPCQSCVNPYVLSLTTLGSPLQGTVLADVAVGVKKKGAYQLKSFPFGFALEAWIFDKFFAFNRTFEDLVTSLDRFGKGKWLPTGKYIKRNYYAFGSDLDTTLNGHVSCNPKNEVKTIKEFAFPAKVGDCVAAYVVNPLYRTIRLKKSATYSYGTTVFGKPKIIITGVSAAQQQGNDVLVSIESALGPTSYRNTLLTGQRVYNSATEGRTHANIADKATLFEVIEFLEEAEAELGDMKPFK